VSVEILLGVGCTGISSACAGATTITVGGCTRACVTLIEACTSSLLATPAAAYTWYVNNIWQV
jgi:hypothetical protein